MKRKCFWILVAVSFLLAAGTASPVAAELYDFGAVPVGQSAVGTFQVDNNGSSPIQVYLQLTEDDPCGFSVSSQYLDVPAGGSAPFQITYAPTDDVACAANFLALNGWDTLLQLELSGTGTVPAPEDPTSKVEPIVIGECNTGIIDREYCDGMLSESVEECIASMDYHGSALRCLGQLSKELHKQKILNRTEIKSLQRCAATALIEQHKENRKTWHQQKKSHDEKKRWQPHGKKTKHSHCKPEWEQHSKKTKHSHYRLGRWHR
jgi:hypothetical protein